MRVDGGSKPNGTPCGTDLYCAAGACGPCTPKTSCTPDASPCHTGSSSCATGAFVCVDSGQNQPDGTDCENGQKCTTGVCGP